MLDGKRTSVPEQSQCHSKKLRSGVAGGLLYGSLTDFIVLIAQ